MKRLGQLLSLALVLSIALVPAGADAAKRKAGPALGQAKMEALLELRHPRGLDRFVRRVSNPSSPHYRQYASVEKLIERYGAKPRTKRRVLGWLAARGLRGAVLATGTHVAVPISAGRAAELLPSAAGATASAAGVSRAIPAGLRGAVESVAVISAKSVVDRHATAAEAAASGARASATAADFGRPYRSILPHTGTAGGCAAGSTGGVEPGLEPFTPNQFLTAYGHADLHARGIKGQGQTAAVVESGGSFKRSDIVRFARCFGVKAPPTKPILVGLNKRPPAEDETTLDLSLLSVGAPELDRILVYEGGESTGAIAATAAAALGSRGNHPNVISISLGICEPEIVGEVSVRGAFNHVFGVAAAAGISVLVSAGDQGSTGCRVDEEESGELTAAAFPAVSLPSSSPYVTAVGGTNFALSRRNRIVDEVVWNDSVLIPWGGGGGISILSPRTPWYQAGIEGYGVGRKVPDVTALADRYPGYAFYCTAAICEPERAEVYGWSSVGGTSAAAPLTAAGIALVNQYVQKRGQRRLGLLNPLLYQLGRDGKKRRGAFNDVVVGNNDIGRALSPQAGGGKPIGCCQARKGYDPASGWGSLKMVGFAKLAAGAGR